MRRPSQILLAAALSLTPLRDTPASPSTTAAQATVPALTQGTVLPSPPPDADEDGMPDSWELDHGFNPNDASDADKDADGDGMSNLEEYRTDTDPQDPQSFFRIESIQQPNRDEVSLEIATSPGLVYGFEYKGSLGDSTWTTLAPPTVASQSSLVLVDNVSGLDSRYYRAFGDRDFDGVAVYSLNSVGFERLEMEEGLTTNRMVGLLSGNNEVSQLMPHAPAGAVLCTFDEVGNIASCCTFFDEVGWLDDSFSPCTLTLEPFELFTFEHAEGPSHTVVFLGQAVSGLPPQILMQPSSQTVPAGSPARFGVDATGSDPVEFQWLKDGIELAGQTNDRLFLPSVTLADAGTYSVGVANPFGLVLSEEATLTVLPPVPPHLVLWHDPARTNGVLSITGVASNMVLVESAETMGGPWSVLLSDTFDSSGSLALAIPYLDSQKFFRALDTSGSVFSSNVVGYIRKTVGPGLDLIGFPLLAQTNQLNALIANPTPGLSVFLPESDTYTVHNHLEGWDRPEVSMRPGQAFFVRNPTDPGTDIQFIMVGEVPEGSLTNVIPAGLSLASSIAPLAGSLDVELQYVPATGDRLVAFNNSLNRFGSPLTYFGPGIGWFDDQFSPVDPYLEVAQGFLIETATNQEWIQDVSVLGGSIHGYFVGPQMADGTRGLINFFTWNPNPSFGLVFDSDGVSRLTSGFLAQVYSGPNPDEPSLVPVGVPEPFLDGAGAGYIRAGTVELTGIASGEPAYVQLRVWSGAAGESYESARSTGKSGKSAIVPITPIGGLGSGLGLVPPSLNTFPSFSVASPIPSVPDITVQPQSQAVAAGSSVTFSATVRSVTPAAVLQWTRNGIALAGKTNATLMLNNVQLADTGTYRLWASNALGQAQSQPAVLTVHSPPFITTAPPSRIATTGEDIRFTVQAEGSIPLNYQWQRNGMDLPGATMPTLLLENVQPEDTADYSIVVSNEFGRVSHSFGMIVLSPPTIVLQPSGTNVDVGDEVTFCTAATGSNPFRYQWRKNGANIAGATQACYRISAVMPADGGNYSAVIANDVGTVASSLAALIVNLPEEVPGDDLADRAALTASPVQGSNLGASKEPGEPDHAGKPGGASVWYSWRAPTNGVAFVDTRGSDFDTLLAVYTGTTIENLRLVAEDEDRGGFFSSSLFFNAEAGTEYLLAIDGLAGATGTIILSVTLDSARVAVPRITLQPSSLTVPPGGQARFMVSAETSVGTLSYQWQFNSIFLPGETQPELTLNNIQVTDVGTYSVVVSNSLGGVTESRPADLEIGQAIQLQSRDKFPDLFLPLPGGGGGLDGLGGGSTPGSFVSVSLGDVGFHIFDNIDSTSSEEDALVATVIGGNSQYMGRFRPETNATMILDTVGSTFDTTMAVYRLAGQDIDDVVATDDNGAPDGIRSQVMFEARATNDYVVAVDRAGTETGIVQLNWRLGLAPEADVQLLTPVASLSENLLLIAPSTDAYPAPTYQWLHNGAPIPGATGESHRLENITAKDAGDYSLIISNLMGVTMLALAQVTVDWNTQVLLQDQFETGPEDWMVLHGAETSSVQFVTSSVAPDGWIQYSDGSNADDWYFVAPPEYAGNQSGAYGGFLQFDLQTTPTTQPLPGADLMLLGAGRRLTRTLTPPPGTEWTRYQVPLWEDGAWRFDHAQGSLPTRHEFLTVLAFADHWLIRGNYGQEPHATLLDNVLVTGPIVNEVVLLKSRQGPPGTIVLEWPGSGAAFQLESRTSLDSAVNWSSVTNFPVTLEGMRSVVLEPGDTPALFQLRKF